MRRLLRIIGTLLILAGVGTLGWAFVVWKWEDPFTSLYTRYEQNSLADAYDERAARFARSSDAAPVSRKALRAQARRYRNTTARGDAFGRISIPSLGVSMVLVNGTDPESLKRGPGRYMGTRADADIASGDPPPAYMPGEGHLVYVAGHRTTYAAPFSRIDEIATGDRVTVDVPYGTFAYTVTRTRIVPSSELSILRSAGREVLALQACHPRFRATHRFIAYAKLAKFTPRRRP